MFKSITLALHFKSTIMIVLYHITNNDVLYYQSMIIKCKYMKNLAWKYSYLVNDI